MRKLRSGTVSWTPRSSSIRSEPNIKLVLLYIDFPREVKELMALSPDQEAQILTDNIAPAQSTDGFFFVYPIVQSFWDSNTQITSSSRPYQGESIYTLMLQLMQQY